MLAKPSPWPGSAFPTHSGEDRLVATGSLGVIIAALAAILAMALPGCSSSSAHSVEPDRPLAAMTAALDAWKEGRSLQSCESSGRSRSRLAAPRPPGRPSTS